MSSDFPDFTENYAAIKRAFDELKDPPADFSYRMNNIRDLYSVYEKIRHMKKTGFTQVMTPGKIDVEREAKRRLFIAEEEFWKEFAAIKKEQANQARLDLQARNSTIQTFVSAGALLIAMISSIQSCVNSKATKEVNDRVENLEMKVRAESERGPEVPPQNQDHRYPSQK